MTSLQHILQCPYTLEIPTQPPSLYFPGQIGLDLISSEI